MNYKFSHYEYGHIIVFADSEDEAFEIACDRCKCDPIELDLIDILPIGHRDEDEAYEFLREREY